MEYGASEGARRHEVEAPAEAESLVKVKMMKVSR